MSDEINLGRLEIRLHCPKCGGNDLEIPDDATDDSLVTCASCGAVLGRWGDAQRQAMEAAYGKASEEIGNALRAEFGDELEEG